MMVVLLVVLKGGVGGVPFQPTFTFDYVIPCIGMLLEYRSCIMKRSVAN